MSFFARLFAMATGGGRVPKTPFEAGVAALERRRFDEALAHFRAALHAATSAAERAAVHNKRGILYVRRGDRSAAIDAFSAALEADARYVPVIVNIGNMLLEDGALADAIVHYEAALRLDDDYSAAHLNLGIAFKKLGRRADAVREFRRANRLEARLRTRTRKPLR